MSDTKNETKTGLSARWQGIKRQMTKIIWPSRETVIKETGVVLAVSIALGAIIAILDRLLLILVDLIIAI